MGFLTDYYILDDAEHRIVEIIDYTQRVWGSEQAAAYFQGLRDAFEQIAERAVPWRAIPTEFGVDGYVARYQRHFIYWKILDDGRVGIALILHERMSQIEQVRQAFES